MPSRRAGSPIAVYARVQCREPKTGQEKVQFYCKDDSLFLSFYYLSMMYSYSTMCIVQCTIYNVPCTMYSYSTMFIIQCTRYNVQCTMYLYSIQCALYNVLVQYNVQCTLYNCIAWAELYCPEYCFTYVFLG